ncbi:MAG: branched-chain amino acid transport system ATP-binding protein [Frankiaceae bacterium]|nr:branched-chain amino acid transport system ATP-binding protein [Frankiaceae bacterium]
MFELRDVDAGYGGTAVLRKVSLAVPPAAVVALLGPNGAGKTTLLRTASGLLRPRRGDLLLDGKVVTRLAPHELKRKGICHIPEGRGIFRSLSVRENLQVQCAGKNEAAGLERAIEVFPKLGQRLKQIAGTLSGGEQQMLALARAYVQQPRVVLLDEVSMGLAPNIVEEIFAFLRQLAADGTSLLLVEQYVTKALNIADYVYVLNRGQVAFVGEPSELGSDEIFRQYIGVSSEQSDERVFA